MPLNLGVLAQAAFGSQPNDASYSWTTIRDSINTPSTGYLRGVSWSRGIRDITGRMETGKSRLLLLNNDRAWDPQNADSDFFDQVVPDLPFRVFFVLNGVQRPVLLHYADDFIRHRTGPNSAEADVPCSDGFAGLALATVRPEIASMTTAISGSNNDLVYTAREAGPAAQDISIEYAAWNKSRERVDVLGNAIKVFYFPGTGPSTANDVITALEGCAQAMALVSVELAPGNDGTGSMADMPPTNLTGGDSASFPEELTGDRIDRVLDQADWPAFLRDVDPGRKTVASATFASDEQGRLLEHLLDVAGVLGENAYGYVNAEGKLRFLDRDSLLANAADPVCTFVDGPESVVGPGEFRLIDFKPSYGKTRWYNEWVGSIPSGVAVRLSNVAEGGRRRSASDLATQLTTERALRVRLQRLLNQFGNPSQRVEQLVVRPGGNASLWDACLSIDVGSAVTFKEYPPGGGDPNEGVYTVIALEGQANDGEALSATRFTYSLWPIQYTNYGTWVDPMAPGDQAAQWGTHTRWAE